MSESVAAKRYAKALFEVAKESKQLGRVEQDLEQIINTVYADEAIVNFLNHPQITADDKKKIIADSVGANIVSITKNLFMQLIDNHRQNELPNIFSEYTKLANDDRGIIGVEVRTITELSAREQEKLSKSLAKEYGKEIRLKNVIDPSIIGGIVINVGDKVYDGSLKTKLNVMKRTITTSRV
jgi:F-type H+-transporting ATPase subunit delta